MEQSEKARNLPLCGNFPWRKEYDRGDFYKEGKRVQAAEKKLQAFVPVGIKGRGHNYKRGRIRA